MTALVVTGAGVGVGVVLLLSGLAPAKPALAEALAALHRPPEARLSPRQRMLRLTAQPLAGLGLPGEKTREDLAICGRDPVAFLAQQVGLAGLGLLAPAATVALLDAMGANVAWSVPLWLGALLDAGGYLVAQASLHADAEQRRLLMRHTLTALLDVVPAALAGGAGVEQALGDASRIATGWAADRIRDAIAAARLTRVPLSQPLAELGEAYGVVQLQQLAGTLRLASGEGTRIRDALTQRGAALSERLTADLEARAESATERMSIPLMALTAVFLLFLIYPAIAAIGGD